MATSEDVEVVPEEEVLLDYPEAESVLENWEESADKDEDEEEEDEHDCSKCPVRAVCKLIRSYQNKKI